MLGGQNGCNVNVHLHQLLIDGAYELNADKIPKDFHKTAPPTVPELEGLVKTIAHRVAKYLEKNGIIVKDDDAPLQLNIPMEEGFSHLQAASSSYRFLLGPNKGKKALVLKSQVDRDHIGKGGLVGKYSGFTLHGGVAVGPGQRDKLEKIARYIARPAISEERLSVNSRGQVIYKLKTPYDDGTTQIVFEPLEFMEKLAALVPRPRVHLTRFHGVLAPNYKYRKLIVPTPPATTPNQGAVDQTQDDNIKNDSTKKKRITWTQLLKRVFKMDMETCNVCGGKITENPLKPRTSTPP
ncbi:MAG: transposase [Bdellovibrionales bacterium]|nr:transposase [Bdellovibrionales bacterium]